MAQITMTRRYRFCAAHRLHTDFLTPQQNWAAFGKCNNPNGHGHNYVVLVTVKSATGGAAYRQEQLDHPRRRILEAQLAHNLRVRDALSEARRTAARVTAAVKRLDGAAGRAADTLRMLSVLDTALTTDPIRYSQPKLVDQLEYLYGMTTSADQRIGRDAVVRLGELEEELKRVQTRVTALLGPAKETDSR